MLARAAAVALVGAQLARAQARVTVVDKVANAASSTFGVRLEIPNPGNRVPGGLTCKVRIGEAAR